MTHISSPMFPLSPSDDGMDDKDGNLEGTLTPGVKRLSVVPRCHLLENGAEENHNHQVINHVADDTKRLALSPPISDHDEDYSDICGKSDSGESPKRTNSGTLACGDKKVYRCQHCKYTTDRKNNLKRHVVTMHEMCTKTLECCDVVFKNKASLRDHVLSCHKNGYDCRICGRNFCRKALLKRHITVHSGQKDYICSVCGYATSHKSNLDRHKRRHGPKFSSDDTDLSKSPPQHFSPKPLALDINKLVGNQISFTPIHRPEPLKPDFYTENHIVDNSSRPYGPPKKFRNRKYILAKRLLYTYRGVNSDLCKQVSKQEKPRVREHNNTTNNNNNNKNNNLLNHKDRELVLGLEKRFLAMRPMTDRKLYRLTSKRLFPALYICRRCTIVYENQLQLTEHVEIEHRDDDWTQVPQRPLTLQARQRAW